MVAEPIWIVGSPSSLAQELIKVDATEQHSLNLWRWRAPIRHVPVAQREAPAG